MRLHEAFAEIPALSVPLPGPEDEHGFYRLYAHVEPDALATGWSRDSIARAISAEGVPCQYGTCAEIYREQAFIAAGLAPAARLPGAARAHQTSLAFFVHPTLGEQEIADTIDAVRKVMEVAS
jgi:dTDP-4-amino-4,6-dideoxygalactose transaminase